jgi:hypothetical protein
VIEGSHDPGELVLEPKSHKAHKKEKINLTCDHIGHVFEENQNPFMQHFYGRTLILQM